MSSEIAEKLIDEYHNVVVAWSCCDASDEELAEARTALVAYVEGLEAERDGLVEALTPSAETKGAYWGEFHVGVPYSGTVQVPWDVIKRIMAAIRKRALAADAGKGGA